MHGVLLAVVHPVNAPHGANLTFAIPVAFFVVVATALFVRFRAPHAVPGHVAFRSSRWATGGEPGRADTVHAAAGAPAGPDAEAPGAPTAQAPGTVQSGTASSATGTTAGEAAASERAMPSSEGTEDGE